MPTARFDSFGELVVEPNVEVTTAAASNINLKPREDIVRIAADIARESEGAPLEDSLTFPPTPRLMFGPSHQSADPAAVEILLPSPGTRIPSATSPISLPLDASDEMLLNLQVDDTSSYGFEDCEVTPEPVSEPLFGRLVEETISEACSECAPWRRLLGFHIHKTSDDIGIGHERVVFAPFEIDATQPSNNFRIRFDSSYGLETPDRAEYFWAKPGRGPQTVEQAVDYQDIRFQMELGGKRFSAITEIPIRILDPDVNGNTAGLGDIVVGNKTVLIDGKLWQITQVFRTYMNSGSATKGLGRGHVAMEPGLLARFEWSDRTYLHGELKYLFAIGADPNHTGEVLRYGFGVSHLLYETDTFAVIPTLEFVGWTVLDGLKTLPNGVLTAVDGEQFGSIHPGVRIVMGPSGDLGLFELGIGGAVNTSSNGWYENQLRIDLKWSF